MLVSKRYRKPVELEFATDVELLPVQSALHTFVKRLYVLAVIRIGEREHGIAVHHLHKFVVQIAAHALRW